MSLTQVLVFEAKEKVFVSKLFLLMHSSRSNYMLKQKVWNETMNDKQLSIMYSSTLFSCNGNFHIRVQFILPNACGKQ